MVCKTGPNFFHQVVLKCIFMFKSNSPVNPKDLQCFSGIDMARIGLVELKYTYFQGVGEIRVRTHSRWP